MAFGRLKYHIAVKTKAEVKAKVKTKDLRPAEAGKTLRLTLIGMKDEDILRAYGLSELRKKRVLRLTHEAQRQGRLLSYEDLNALLLSSISTLKRDVSLLEKQGCAIHLKGRRRG